MHTRQLPVVVLVAALLATAVASGVASAQATSWPSWDGTGSGEFRSWVIDDGEFIWTNTVLSARGGNNDGLHHPDYWGALVTGGELPIDERDDVERHLTWGAFGLDRWATDGDQELPLDDDTWPEFTGETAELRLEVEAADLVIRWRFTSFPAPDAQIATLTFSTVGALPAAAPWPREAAVMSRWDVAVTTWGTGADITSTAGAIAIDAEDVLVGDHTVSVRVPLDRLPPGPWILNGGSGLTDPATGDTYWAVPPGSATVDTPGSGATLVEGSPVWSLLFADDEPWVFGAEHESDLLTSGDVSAAVFELDPTELAAGVDRRPAPSTGVLSRWYESAHDFGDGIDKSGGGTPPSPIVVPPEVPLDDAAATFVYTGRLQPYGMQVPAAYHARTEPWPLILYLHGLNNYYHEPFGVIPNLAELGEGGYLFAGLLGRGDLSYRGMGELDVLEALADIQRHYDVDPARIHIMGHSMGSIGSHNVVTRNPDLFAGMAPAAITAADDLLVNLRHIPYLHTGGFGDFLDPQAQSTVNTFDALHGLGYQAIAYVYTLKTHESSLIYDRLPQTLALFDASRLVEQPAEFTYRRLPDDDHPELGLVHDGAYAVDGMQFVDEEDSQQVDVRSFAIPHRPLDPANATRTEEQVDEGGPSGRTGADRYESKPAFGPEAPVENRVEVTLDNVASLELDAAALGLVLGDEIVLDVDTTDAARLDVRVGAMGVWLVQVDDGQPRPTAVVNGDLAVEVPAGDHRVTIAQVAASDDDEPLPSTGAVPVVALLGLLLLSVAGRAAHR